MEFKTTAKKATLALLELAKAAECDDLLKEIPKHASDSIGELKKFLYLVWTDGMPGSYMQGPEFRIDSYLDGEPDNVIRWVGTWTEGRYVQVTFQGDESLVEYSTGTGKPSTYLQKIFKAAGIKI